MALRAAAQAKPLRPMDLRSARFGLRPGHWAGKELIACSSVRRDSRSHGRDDMLKPAVSALMLLAAGGAAPPPPSGYGSVIVREQIVVRITRGPASPALAA